MRGALTSPWRRRSARPLPPACVSGGAGQCLVAMTADGQPHPDADLAADIAARTDSYFNRTRQVVARFGDKRVTYAVFLRRPVISAPRLMVGLAGDRRGARAARVSTSK